MSPEAYEEWLDLMGRGHYPPKKTVEPEPHWCTYCNGRDPDHCQFNPNRPTPAIYTTDNTGVKK